MNYAIETLQKESKRIKKALSAWDEKHYPEARKQRDKNLSDLTKAIQILQNKPTNDE